MLGLSANYRSDGFRETISKASLEMTKHDGPVLIHCVEGKDRTGFVCTLLSSLTDSTYEEIVNDYMITYENYYKVTKEEYPERYEAIKVNVDNFLYFLTNTEEGSNLKDLDLKKAAENYLLDSGLTSEEVNKIQEYIR